MLKADRFQDFRMTAALWTAINPRLYQGEVGYEFDTGKIKRGDGIRYWNDLAYWTPWESYTDTAVANLLTQPQIMARSLGC